MPNLQSSLIDMPPFTVQVKIHARARRLTLRYDARQGCFTLTRPKRFNAGQIAAFLQANQNWMAHQAQIAPPATRIQPSGTIMIEGVARQIVYDDKPGIRIDLLPEALHIACRPARFGRVLQRFLHQRAAEILGPLSQQKAAQTGKTIAGITFRDTKSRWGSCASDGRLCYNWRIIMAPIEVIDYLVAHEVAHLNQMNHSAKFWTLCRELTPHTTFGKHWLKTNGAALHHVRFNEPS